MTAGVYAIVNTTNGMAYVGSSISIETRWSYHRSSLKHGICLATSMIEAWRALGPEHFEWRILEVTDTTDDALEQAERRWMSSYADRLYNARKQASRPRLERRRRARPPAAGGVEGE